MKLFQLVFIVILNNGKDLLGGSYVIIGYNVRVNGANIEILLKGFKRDVLSESTTHSIFLIITMRDY